MNEAERFQRLYDEAIVGNNAGQRPERRQVVGTFSSRASESSNKVRLLSCSYLRLGRD